MVVLGAHCEGFVGCPVERLDNGLVVPAVDIETLQSAHQQVVRTQIELSVAAEELGYDFVVHPENHFDLMTACAPDPITVQTAVAARTEEIRLLQAANSLTRHDPVRLAERLAVLDVVSDGRVDVGLAKGSGKREAAQFGAEAGSDVFEEYVDVLRGAWTEPTLSHHGESYDAPPEKMGWDNDQEYFYASRDDTGLDPSALFAPGEDGTTLAGLPVLPKPVQEPHPQLWRATASPEGAATAAADGKNVVTFCGNFEKVAALVDSYYEAAAAADWPDRRPAHDGEPFARGFDRARWRGVAIQVPLFDTDAADEDGLDVWKLGQEATLTKQRSALPPDEQDRVPVDADRVVTEMDAPIVADTDEIVDRLAELRVVCDADELALLPSVPVPGLDRDRRYRQLQSFVESVAPRLA